MATSPLHSFCLGHNIKKTLAFLSLFSICLSFQAQAQQDVPSRWPVRPPYATQRTWPVDSCLYFQLPIDFLVTSVRTAGPSQDTLAITMRFRSSDPSGPTFQGIGRVILNDTLIFWDDGLRGNGILILPESAFSSSSGGESNLVFPMPANGFIFEINGIKPELPLQVNMMIRDMEIEL